MTRHDNRKNDELRPVQIQRNYTRYAPGSVLIAMGNTKVLCTAFVEESIPPFLRDSGQGWVTAEYGMLPSATHTRMRRELNKGKPSGRTNEIQRLIGRSLRSIIDLNALGERSIYIDCDVIQADGGTRTASITGGMLALHDAVQTLMKEGKVRVNPIKEFLAAVSVGRVNDEVLLDLCYEEDSTAQVDMNVVMTESGRFVELQGTAEGDPFGQETLSELIDISKKGISELIAVLKGQVEIAHA